MKNRASNKANLNGKGDSTMRAIRLNNNTGWNDVEAKKFESGPITDYFNSENLTLLFVCPDCGQEYYCNWKYAQNNLEPEKITRDYILVDSTDTKDGPNSRNYGSTLKLDFSSVPTSFTHPTGYLTYTADGKFKTMNMEERIECCKEFEAYEKNIVTSARKELQNLLNNYACQECKSKNLSFAPGYFLFSATAKSSHLANAITDVLASKAHSTDIRFEHGTVNYYSLPKCLEEKKTQHRSESRHENCYSDNNFAYEFYKNKRLFHTESVNYDTVNNFKLFWRNEHPDFRQAHDISLKDDSISLYHFSEGANAEDKEVHIIISIDTAFDLLKEYRLLIEKDKNEKSITDLLERLETDVERKYPTHAISREIDATFIKDYLEQLVTLESSIYEITKRYPEVLTLGEEQAKKESRFHNTIAEETELEKSISDLEQHIAKKSYPVATYEEFMPYIPKPQVDPKELPDKPTKPQEPVYEIPGLFNKRRVNMENEQKRKLFEASLAEWTLANQQYWDDVRNIKAQKEEEYSRKYNAAIPQAQQAAEKENERRLQRYEDDRVRLQSKIEKATQALEKKKVWLKENSRNALLKDYDQGIDLLKKLVDARAQLLSANIIYRKYNNLVAHATMYEYFQTGRCTTFDGPNGAYNIYEAEMRANTIIGQLSTVIDSLEQIKQNQYMLYSQMRTINSNLNSLNQTMYSMNSTMSSMNSKLGSIAYNTQVTAYNTAVGAYYAKKNAELTNALGFMLALK